MPYPFYYRIINLLKISRSLEKIQHYCGFTCFYCHFNLHIRCQCAVDSRKDAVREFLQEFMGCHKDE